MKIAMMMGKMEKMKTPIKSDFYFNHPEEVKEMKEYCDPYPVDNLGICIPEGKSIDNLKKMEESVQEAYGLKAGGEY